MKKSFIYLFAFCAIAFFSSCTKNAPTANLNFNLKAGSQDLNFADNYTIGSESTTANFDVAQFYVSNIKLIKDDNSEIAINSYQIISPDATNIDLGEIEEGTYTQIQFDIGIDSTTNHVDPTTYDLSNQLAPQSPSMHWNWNAGYRFLRVDGTFDSNADNMISEADTTFQLHIGLDSYLRTVTIPYPFEAANDTEQNLSVNADIAALFNYNLSESITVHTTIVNDKNTGIVNNLPSIFSR